MATYCTDLDLKDVFPQIDEFDSKTQLFGWEADTSEAGRYKAEDSGVSSIYARSMNSKINTTIGVYAFN